MDLKVREYHYLCTIRSNLCVRKKCQRNLEEKEGTSIRCAVVHIIKPYQKRNETRDGRDAQKIPVCDRWVIASSDVPNIGNK
jgi:hypothetical protein